MNTPQSDEKLDRSMRALIFGPFIVLLGCLVVTAVATYLTHRFAVRRNTERFSEQVHHQKELLDTRIEKYEIALWGLRDFIMSKNAITRGEWESRLHSTDPRVNFRGIVELGYARLTLGSLGSDRPEEIMRGAVHRSPSREIRTETLPGYRYAAIILDGGRHMKITNEFGTDLYGSPDDRAAQSDSSNNGGMATTRRVDVRAPSGAGGAAGIRIYLATYADWLGEQWNSRGSPATLTDAWNRHATAFNGFLFASLETDEFLKGIYGDKPREVEFQLFSATSCDEAQWLNPGTSSRPPSNAMFTYERELNWYGQKWRVRFYTTERFHNASLRGQAWWVGGIGTVLSIALAGLFQMQVRERQRAETTAERLALAKAQLQISQEERAALGRDLHDGAIQSLYAVTLHLERLGRVAQKTPEALPEAVSIPEGLVRDVILDLRRLLAGDLSSVGFESTLESGLEKLTGGFTGSSEAGLRLSGAVPGATRWPVEFRFHVLQMAREALSNAVRHSGASTIRVDCSELPDGTALIAVRDNGRGFEPASAESAGHGLRNLRLRAAQIGATIEVLSTIGTGTELLIRVPPPRTLPAT